MSHDLHNSMTRRIRGHFRLLYSSPVRWALLGMLLLAGVGTARADSFDNFVLTDGTQTMTWTLPSSPTPSSFVLGDRFGLTGVTVLENGTTPVTTTQMNFFNGNAVSDGGVASRLVNPLDFIDAFVGESQLYSGPESNPTFIPGTYAETGPEDDAAQIALDGCPTGTTEDDAGCGISDTWALSTSSDVNLTLTITQTPEPSSVLLLGSGLLGLMGMSLRRKRLA